MTPALRVSSNLIRLSGLKDFLKDYPYNEQRSRQHKVTFTLYRTPPVSITVYLISYILIIGCVFLQTRKIISMNAASFKTFTLT